MNNKREKKENSVDLKTTLGIFLSPFSVTMSSMGVAYLSMYLTDFSGIDSAMGKTGFAATFAAMFIVFTRIIDAIDDPLQGWILDSAKERKFGKYRMFGIIGAIAGAIGLIAMYGMPDFIKSNPVLIWVWAVVFYLVLETGTAMGGVTTPLTQKMTKNQVIRSKFAGAIRLGNVTAALPFMYFIPMITIIGSKIGNLGKAATLSIAIFSVIFATMSIVGYLLIKEPFHEKANIEHEEKISVKEIITLLKTVKPLWIHCVAVFIGALATSTSPLYFLKMKFFTDASTGKIDLVGYAAITGIFATVTLIPSFVTPFILPQLMKIFKSPDKTIRFCYFAMALGFGLITVLNMLGVLTPGLLVAIFVVTSLPNGMCAMLWVLIVIECADYAEYNLGRNMSAMVNSLYNFVLKASNVIGVAIPSFLLATVGYSINEQTGDYMGSLSELPKVVDGLGLLLGPLPIVFAVTAILIYKFGYKITPEYRAKMSEALKLKYEGAKERDDDGNN